MLLWTSLKKPQTRKVDIFVPILSVPEINYTDTSLSITQAFFHSYTFLTPPSLPLCAFWCTQWVLPIISKASLPQHAPYICTYLSAPKYDHIVRKFMF